MDFNCNILFYKRYYIFLYYSVSCKATNLLFQIFTSFGFGYVDNTINGMTQENLAEKAGISPGYLSQVETPSFIQPISLKTLFAFADIFKIPPYKLLEFEDEIKYDE